MLMSEKNLREKLRAEMVAAQVIYDDLLRASSNTSATALQLARATARYEAHAHRQDTAFGLQQNDVTGEQEACWCPATMAYHPCVMTEVHGTAHPDGSVSVVDESARIPAWRMGKDATAVGPSEPTDEPDYTEYRLRMMEQGL